VAGCGRGGADPDRGTDPLEDSPLRPQGRGVRQRLDRASRRRTAENPTALEGKFNNIRAQPTWTGRATRAAGTVAGHFVSQALAVTALVLALAGAALIAFAMLWG
jgi:hypothetical protein